jgi:hypothetical protein
LYILQIRDAQSAVTVRMGCFAVLCILPASCVLGCQYYEYKNRGSWYSAPPRAAYAHGPIPPDDGPRPNVETFMLKIFMSLVVGITAALWTWSGSGVQMVAIWRRRLFGAGGRCCGAGVGNKPGAGGVAIVMAQQQQQLQQVHHQQQLENFRQHQQQQMVQQQQRLLPPPPAPPPSVVLQTAPHQYYASQAAWQQSLRRGAPSRHSSHNHHQHYYQQQTPVPPPHLPHEAELLLAPGQETSLAMGHHGVGLGVHGGQSFHGSSLRVTTPALSSAVGAGPGAGNHFSKHRLGSESTTIM